VRAIEQVNLTHFDVLRIDKDIVEARPANRATIAHECRVILDVGTVHRRDICSIDQP
jgi:hypothetical protein